MEACAAAHRSQGKALPPLCNMNLVAGRVRQPLLVLLQPLLRLLRLALRGLALALAARAVRLRLRLSQLAACPLGLGSRLRLRRHLAGAVGGTQRHIQVVLAAGVACGGGMNERRLLLIAKLALLPRHPCLPRT